MHIILDLQAAQTSASASRGVGRYTIALATAMIRSAPQHHFTVLLNDRFAAAAISLRRQFAALVPAHRIVTFAVPANISPGAGASDWRRAAARRAREAVIERLAPDHVHVFNLFEGLGEDAVISNFEKNNRFTTSITLHDIIPFLLPELYLTSKDVRQWYNRNLRSLLRADLLLANSESSRRDAIQHLSFPEGKVVNVSSAVDGFFSPKDISEGDKLSLQRRLGLQRPFILYCGGIDPRKNVDGLIKAFASLPLNLRDKRQLAIVCSVEPSTRTNLLNYAKSLGLGSHEITFTGYVSDEDLLAIYNLAELFVFPSFYEGFGLPILEAMSCGLPVIGSNNSSIPEVIGDPDALFDPHDLDAIAKKITEVLSDPDRLGQMGRDGRERSQGFSWDFVGARAIKAIEALHNERTAASCQVPTCRLRLAYVSPLWPAETGIASYSHVLVLELLRHFDIDLVIDQESVDDTLLQDMLDVRDKDYFEKNYSKYDRAIYNFGNSDFHEFMFPLLRRCPGVVILHDLFLSGIKHWVGKTVRGEFERTLVSSHGYDALVDHLQASSDGAIWKYTCNGDVIDNAAGIIVHSEFSRRALIEAGVPSSEVVQIAQICETAPDTREAARKELGFSSDEIVICTFGNLGPTKLNHITAEAFRLLNNVKRYRIFFVGPASENAYVQNVRSILADVQAPAEITGSVDEKTYRRYLAASDLGIQLRTNSRGETSRAILDCLAHGLPTIISAEGPAAEYPDDCVIKIAPDASASYLARIIDEVAGDASRRKRVGEAGRRFIQDRHHPSEVGLKFHQAIVQLGHESRIACLRRSTDDLRSLPGVSDEPLHSKADVARALALNLRSFGRPRLLIDVSEIVRRDWKSGIQRVVRNIVTEFLRTPRLPLSVIPVYADSAGHWRGFRHARRFAEELLGVTESGLLGEEEAIEIAAGDVFLGLDLFPKGVAEYVDLGVFETARARGAHIVFVVYDLIAILHPEYFVPGAREGHTQWMRAVTKASDLLVCISKAVADDVDQFLDTEFPGPFAPTVRHFPLGCDVGEATRQAAASRRATIMGRNTDAALNILMVGTVEPRKGHAAVLEAFEELWRRGSNLNLTIVGKVGWIVDELAVRLRSHAESGKRLFWYEAASDEQLARLYTSASGLIAASYAEGFGLPLIEAAYLGLPILARDIPVFREIAGGHATFFSGDGLPLVLAIEAWGLAIADGTACRSEDMPLATWKDSADKMAEILSAQFVPSRGSM